MTEAEAILQAITDPENQPSQFGTVPAADRDLLVAARTLLERYMFDGETCRDDIAELCQKIDDHLA